MNNVDRTTKFVNCRGWVENAPWTTEHKVQEDCELFSSAEEAWVWTVNCIEARHSGEKSPGTSRRPCQPDDIINIVNRLYRNGELSERNIRVLENKSMIGVSTSEFVTLFDEAMSVLDRALRRRCFIALSIEVAREE